MAIHHNLNNDLSFQSRPAVTDSAANSLRLLKAKVERETLTQVNQAQVQRLLSLPSLKAGQAALWLQVNPS